MTQRSIPTRTLSDRPHLDQLKRQAKELLEAYRHGNADAVNEVHAHYRHADRASFALHDSQLVVARAYGFDSWPKLKAFVDGITVRRLVDAVRAGDLAAVQAMVDARPELVHLDVAENDEHRALHHAVLQRRPDIVRFLMQHGADARKGIWPHRGATTAFTIATERGYDEIVRIIEEEERGRPADAPFSEASREQSKQDASGSARAAIESGDLVWLRTRHQEGALTDGSGLLSHAVSADRPDVLELLLQLGLDPDEAGRVPGLEEVVPTWGGPLRLCAISGNVTAAGILLAHGANANTNVYAAGPALYEAHKRGDDRMVALLETHGAGLTAVDVAELGLVGHAATMLAEYAAERPGDGAASEAMTVPQALLWGAIESPSPEIVEIALRATDWRREDPRWHGILENGLYLRPESDRRRHLDAFRLVMSRCDPNVQSRRGTTILHEIAAARGGLTAHDRLVYATLLLDRGARLDVRDHLLESTPLGWACRWGRLELVELLLGRGADPIEADARPWASPMAWAARIARSDVTALLVARMYQN